MIERLKKFELLVKEKYEKGLIKAPIHLSGGNEKPLIKIFKKIEVQSECFNADFL